MTITNIWGLEVHTEITSNISPLISIINKHCHSRKRARWHDTI